MFGFKSRVDYLFPPYRATHPQTERELRTGAEAQVSGLRFDLEAAIEAQEDANKRLESAERNLAEATTKANSFRDQAAAHADKIERLEADLARLAGELEEARTASVAAGQDQICALISSFVAANCVSGCIASRAP